jgi:hypothetical protein
MKLPLRPEIEDPFAAVVELLEARSKRIWPVRTLAIRNCAPKFCLYWPPLDGLVIFWSRARPLI